MTPFRHTSVIHFFNLLLPFLLLTILTLSACSTTPTRSPQNLAEPSPSDASLTDSFRLQILVTRSPTQDSWTVTFQTNHPVTELIFDRQTNRFRGKNWISKSADLEIREVDKKERILSKSGAPFSQATFEFQSYYDQTPKDYEFFQAFTDGSLVIYTGHLNACPVHRKCTAPVEFDLSGRTNDHIITRNHSAKESLRWLDETGRGTYIYFGQIQPVERPDQATPMAVIIDPGLPDWLKQKFHQLLPRLFDFYTKNTGHPLPFRPFIFFSYSAESSGTRHSGGALPGIIQLTLKGKGWQRENLESFQHLGMFLAHEAAHLWNSQLFPSSTKEMWMHEGGADAFAFLSLFKLGLIDTQKFLEFQTEAYNHCLSQLKGRPLQDVQEDPNFHAHYTCGSILALITYGAVKHQDSNRDLFSFWKALFDRMKTQGIPSYDETLYFKILEEMSDSSVVNTIQAFIHGPVQSPEALLQSELTRQGVTLQSREQNLPKDYHRKQAKDLVRLLMQEDCKGRHGLYSSNDQIETEAMNGCTVFSKPYTITQIGPHRVSQGTQAYDFVENGCKNSITEIHLTVKESNALIKVPCPKSIPKRLPYFEITSIPLSSDPTSEAPETTLSR